MQVTIDKIKVKFLPDMKALDSPNKHLSSETSERISEFHFGKWIYVTIFAEAIIEYGEEGEKHQQILVSHVIDAIPSYDREYLRHNAEEVLNNLKEHCAFFQVCVSDWEEKKPKNLLQGITWKLIEPEPQSKWYPHPSELMYEGCD